MILEEFGDLETTTTTLKLITFWVKTRKEYFWVDLVSARLLLDLPNICSLELTGRMAHLEEYKILPKERGSFGKGTRDLRN